ncbi:MAG: chorismate mutase [Candidatus Eisenbacteria bacterium]|uniref:chorismate mutase n=1 Tax=Eiseniibacteriota bacterium TaxID=2212470 RepID=A0A933W482_UNCEI|nr:chorismate mutase [Candidatus Eisenbacteria bacterium]
MSLTVAAVRGAISVPANTAPAIRTATSRLLAELVERNQLHPANVVSAVFTATPDLTADFPAHSARQLGWTDVPLLGATEMSVPGAPKRIVRVLVTVRDVPRGEKLRPVYLDDAAKLRPDLADLAPAATHEHRVAIVGLGQIGGSIGLALGTSGRWHRTGFDARRRTAASALANGALDEVAPTLEDACANADVVVLATPVDTLPALVARAAAACRPGTVLLDTGSTRRGITEALAAAAKLGLRACGGHPIAGNEGRGFASARATLFANATFALFPVRGAAPKLARALVRDLGARSQAVKPAEHDAALARTSHLPYVLATALARVGGAAAKRRLSGPGYAGMTRLAASDPRTALAYVRANRGNVEDAWRALRREVDRDVRKLRTAARAPR